MKHSYYHTVTLFYHITAFFFHFYPFNLFANEASAITYNPLCNILYQASSISLSVIYTYIHSTFVHFYHT